MLSDEAGEELKRLARSSALREDCERLRAASLRPISLDQFLTFLTEMSAMLPETACPVRPFVPYTNVKL